ncbi:hypothetical protein [Paraglaciecola sp.]|uniref:hypothetical protein n=1 Tax=Pseudomonadati TaxID=3379134 RepID=UPI00273E6CCB|nr:hypothetical protein [Paraglaciecola sp.]MDP5032182.1 hypothetical protein [Paraglaciecola sp.]
MNLKQVSEIAKAKGIPLKKHSKTQLIHLIQHKEGNFPCVASATQGCCDQSECQWRKDCLSPRSTH